MIRASEESDIPAIARVKVASWRSAYRGILPQPFLDELSEQKQIERHRKIMPAPGSIYRVAETEPDGVVGFLTGGPERSGDPTFTGELYALYVLDSHHRKNVGSSLLRSWAAALTAAGHRSALVWAFSANANAAAFYQRHGAKRIREQPMAIAGVTVPETAWGWNDNLPL